MPLRPPAQIAQAAVHRIVEQLERGTTDALPPETLRMAASIYINEARKHAFRLRRADRAGELRQFGCHLRAAFADAPDPMVVMDWRDEIAEAAGRLASDGDPVPSLILHVTWAEHWATGAIVPVAEREGLSKTKCMAVLKDTFRRQLDWLQEALGQPLSCAPDLAATASVRHKLVHYTWRASSPAAVEAHRQRVREIVRSFPEWMEECRGYEDRHVTGPFADDAIRLFGIDPRIRPT